MKHNSPLIARDPDDVPFYTGGAYDLRRSLGFLLRENGRMAIRLGEAAFADAGVSFTHWLSLFLLRKQMVATVGDLGRCLGFSSGAVTRLVDQLEKRALVIRSRSATDRRVMCIILTADGSDMADALLPRLLAMWNTVLADFGHQDAHELIASLSRLAGVLRQRLDQDDPLPFIDI